MAAGSGDPQQPDTTVDDGDAPALDASQGWLNGLSRRRFLAAGGVLATAAAVPGCTDTRLTGPAEGPAAADPGGGVDVPEHGGALGRFLNPEQALLVEAVVARLIPGDDEEPGAVQAGVVDYVDRLLATHEGYPERTYTRGPFAQTYEGDEEPEPEEGVVWVAADQIDRYGWQAMHTPREIYRMGLARLQQLAQQRHGAPFDELSGDQQDGLLEAIEDAEDDDVTELFEPVGADTFFGMVHKHTVEGFLSDPIYGGNRDLVGWRHVGFPGSQRGYSPEELLDPDFHREPQGIGDLPMMHAGHRADEQGDALGSVRRRHPNAPLD